MDDIFLTHLDELGPNIFRLVVHLKEAVRERQRMRLFTSYWELEESTRRSTLYDSLYREAQVDFSRAERESRMLLTALLERHPPPASVADTQYLAQICSRNKSSLRQTDAQLDVFQRYFEGNRNIRSSIDVAASTPGVVLGSLTSDVGISVAN